MTSTELLDAQHNRILALEKEVERLRRIEAAARTLLAEHTWYGWADDLKAALDAAKEQR